MPADHQADRFDKVDIFDEHRRRGECYCSGACAASVGLRAEVMFGCGWVVIRVRRVVLFFGLLCLDLRATEKKDTQHKQYSLFHLDIDYSALFKVHYNNLFIVLFCVVA